MRAESPHTLLKMRRIAYLNQMILRVSHKLALKLQSLLCCCIILSLLSLTQVNAAVPGTVIDNTAAANFDNNGSAESRTSNTVSLTVLANPPGLTPAVISFLQFSPSGGSATNTSATGCSSSGAITGPFTPLSNPTFPGLGVLDVSNPIDLAVAGSYNQGEPIFVRVTDANRNLDSLVRDVLAITINSSTTGDQETLQLSETGDNTGEFVGFVQSVSEPNNSGDCQLAVSSGETITASYTDIFDNTDSTSSNILIDPFGIVFNSNDGSPVSGVSVTLINVVTGLPADVFGIDTVSTFPSTVVTGSTVTDSGGTVYNLAAGEYRFPSVAPGTYRLQVTTNDFTVPSLVSVTDLQGLNGAPFVLDAVSSFGGNFNLVIGPPLNIDIPIDPFATQENLLFVNKQVNEVEAAIGDFIQYEIQVTNIRTTVNAASVVVIDDLPTGFRYQSGSTQFNNSNASDPIISGDGSQLRFDLGSLAPQTTASIKYVVEVSSGTPFGSATNNAFATDSNGGVSNVASATTRVVDDLLSTRSFLVGSVTQGACGPQARFGPNSINYQLQSERQGNEVLHTFLIDASAEASFLTMSAVLPKVLGYQRGSATLDGKNILDPKRAGNTLFFPVQTQSDQASRLQFKTKIVDGVVGNFSLQTRLRSNQTIDRASGWAVNQFNSGQSFTVTKGGSEEQTWEADYIEPVSGVAGVRLLLEDGRFVVTDERGMYHFEAIQPGNHVVQVDPASIPPHLELYSCATNTRFAGAANSQFVDVQPGLIWRANFYLREKVSTRAVMSARLSSKLSQDEITYNLTIEGKQHVAENLRATIILPDGLQPVAKSARLNGQPIADPKARFGTLVFQLGDRLQDNWNDELLFKVSGKPTTEGELNTQALLSFAQGETKINSDFVSNTLFYQKAGTTQQNYLVRPQFGATSAELTKADKLELDRWVNLLGDTQVKAINVNAHLNNEPLAFNLRQQYFNENNYSKALAQSVVKYLQSKSQFKHAQFNAQGCGASQPLADNDSSVGRATNKRVELQVESIKSETFEITQPRGRAQRVVSAQEIIAPSIEEQLLNAKAEQTSTQQFDQQWLDQANNELQWLTPNDGFNPAIPSLAIAIKHSLTDSINLLLNGEPVNDLSRDGRDKSADAQRAITRWRGVDLIEGDNHFVVSTTNSKGEITGQIEKVVHFSGLPQSVELVEEYSQLNANGRDPVIVAVRFLDRWGYPVREGVVGNFDVAPEFVSSEEQEELERRTLNANPLRQNQYTIVHDGIALIELEPTTQTGRVELDFQFDDQRREQVSAWLQAQQQDWILVGLAEGTTGYNELSGNAQALSDHQFQDNLFEDGRLAFYAKGQIKGEWLLTVAYDSERKERNSFERLFQTIDPDEYYTLYGDATEQQFDAASSRKLYLRIERQQFYALFGDFNTDLTVTELARYERAFTGVKSEYEGNNFAYNAFVADSDQVFVRDEIQGNGTSGLYQLSSDPIVINSENITLETRDRFQSQNIINSQPLQRHIDYNIDPITGTIFFRQPVQSRDENFNPIFIVARYEVAGSDDRQISAGGRASFTTDDDALEAGVTAITQGDTGTDGHLLAADVTYQINEQLEARAEFATSEATSNEIDNKGDAYLAELEYRGESTDANLYYRRQDNKFGLDQQGLNNAGVERYGAEVRHELSSNLNINAEAYQEEVLDTDAQRTIVAAEVEKTYQSLQVAAGLRYAKDQFEERESDDSVLLTARASRRFLEDRLQLRTSAEIDVEQDNSVDHPTRFIVGADYLLNDFTELFAEHEYSLGEDQDTNTTRVGTRLVPWNQAEINTSVQQQVSESGPRLFSNLGLVQGWQYNDNLSFDFSIDRSDTLREPGGQAFNANVPLSSGSLNDDFSAVSVGANYTAENWSTSSRIEYRDGTNDVQRGYLFNLYREQATGFGMALSARIFDTDSNNGSDQVNADLRYSLVYRPDDSPWTILNRTDFEFDSIQEINSRIRNRRVVNNLNLNYTYDHLHQYAAHWGVRYTLDNIDGQEFDGVTNLLGFQYTYDLHARLDLSLHGDVLHSSNSNNFRYSFGPSVGANVYKNLWLTVGYNFAGFEDDDFRDAEFTTSGSFATIRFKFDTSTIDSIKSLLE